jgi:hypothetical protein
LNPGPHDYQKRDCIQRLKKELEKLELLKSNLQNDLMDRVITSQDYEDMKGRLEKEIVLMKAKLLKLQQEISPFRIYLRKEIPMLENLLEYYRKSDGVTKKKILNTIFAEKLILEKGKVANPIFTESVQLILRISEVMRMSEEKKEVDLNQSLVATLPKISFSSKKKLQPSVKKCWCECECEENQEENTSLN